MSLKSIRSRDYLLVSCNPIGFPLAWCRRGSATPTQPLITRLTRLPRVHRLVEEGPTTHTRLARVKTKNAALSNLKMLGAVVSCALVRLVSRSCDPWECWPFLEKVPIRSRCADTCNCWIMSYLAILNEGKLWQKGNVLAGYQLERFDKEPGHEPVTALRSWDGPDSALPPIHWLWTKSPRDISQSLITRKKQAQKFLCYSRATGYKCDRENPSVWSILPTASSISPETQCTSAPFFNIHIVHFER